MDSASSSFHELHSLIFCLALITLIMSFIIQLIARSLRVWCSCEICKTYVESNWTGRFTNLCDWYAHLLNQSPTRTIHIHVLNTVVTANPANVEYMLKTRFDNFPKGKPFSAILGDFLGRGIFNVDGDTWRFQRKMANLELARVSLRDYAFQVVNEEIDGRLLPLMRSVAKGKGEVDLQDVFRRFAFDCICRFSFGLDPRCLETFSMPLSEFAVSFDLASRLSAERAMVSSSVVWKVKRWLNIGSERRLRRAIKNVDLLAQEVIRQRRRFGFSDQKDLLSRFMVSINDEDYLRDIVVNFLLAGRDTVGSALTSFFWLVARHPEVGTAILNEADMVIGEGKKITSYEQMRELHYLPAAIHESMRIYPPVQFDSKFCLENDTLPDGTFVKKGTRVTYHPYAMGRIEEIWGSDCFEFKPERWLRDGVFCQENPFKYPVFQAGLRVCLGKEMALMELQSVAISFLRQFSVELVHYHPVPRFSSGLTATYRDGLPVLVHER